VSIIRIGSTKKYSDNWDAAFGAKPKKKTTAKASAAKPAKRAKKKKK